VSRRGPRDVADPSRTDGVPRGSTSRRSGKSASGAPGPIEASEKTCNKAARGVNAAHVRGRDSSSPPDGVRRPAGSGRGAGKRRAAGVPVPSETPGEPTSELRLRGELQAIGIAAGVCACQLRAELGELQGDLEAPLCSGCGQALAGAVSDDGLCPQCASRLAQPSVFCAESDQHNGDRPAQDDGQPLAGPSWVGQCFVAEGTSGDRSGAQPDAAQHDRRDDASGQPAGQLPAPAAPEGAASPLGKIVSYSSTGISDASPEGRVELVPDGGPAPSGLEYDHVRCDACGRQMRTALAGNWMTQAIKPGAKYWCPKCGTWPSNDGLLISRKELSKRIPCPHCDDTSCENGCQCKVCNGLHSVPGTLLEHTPVPGTRPSSDPQVREAFRGSSSIVEPSYHAPSVGTDSSRMPERPLCAALDAMHGWLEHAQLTEPQAKLATALVERLTRCSGALQSAVLDATWRQFRNDR
jgi:hypothetical protein